MIRLKSNFFLLTWTIWNSGDFTWLLPFTTTETLTWNLWDSIQVPVLGLWAWLELSFCDIDLKAYICGNLTRLHSQTYSSVTQGLTPNHDNWFWLTSYISADLQPQGLDLDCSGMCLYCKYLHMNSTWTWLVNSDLKPWDLQYLCMDSNCSVMIWLDLTFFFIHSNSKHWELTSTGLKRSSVVWTWDQIIDYYENVLIFQTC